MSMHKRRPSETDKYVAITNYQPQDFDELELSRGDILYVQEKYSDGWLRGFREKDGESGIFPGNFTVLYNRAMLEKREPIKSDEATVAGEEMIEEQMTSTHLEEPIRITPPPSSPVPERPLTDEEKVEKIFKKRTNIANEILSTEISYVKHLEMVLSVFSPLQESGILSADEYAAIFGNVRSVYRVNTVMLRELTEVMKTWDASTMLGPVFKRLAPFLKIYEVYCNHHATATERVARHVESSSKFAAFLKNAMTQCAGQTLDSLLLMPVQRIPRYNLLLTDLHKHTADDHPDMTPLSESLQEIRDVASGINEKMRRIENDFKIMSIEKMFPHDKMDLVESLQFFSKGQNSRKQQQYDRRTKDISKGSVRGHPMAPTRSKKLARPLSMSKAVDVMEVGWHVNEEKPNAPRLFICEASLQRLSGPDYRKIAKRYMFLFNDIVVIGEETGKNKYRLKDKAALVQCWIRDGVVELDDKAEYAFILGMPRRNYVFLVTSISEKKSLVDKLNKALMEQKSSFEQDVGRLCVPDTELKGITMRARREYQGTSSVEISFPAGSDVVVFPGLYDIDCSDDDGWMHGLSANRFGWFPGGCMRSEKGEDEKMTLPASRPLTLSDVLNVKRQMFSMKTVSNSETSKTFFMKIFRTNNTFKSLAVPINSSTVDTIKTYFEKMKLVEVVSNWTLNEVSDDNTVDRCLGDNELPCNVAKIWGCYAEHMKFVVKEISLPDLRDSCKNTDGSQAL